MGAGGWSEGLSRPLAEGVVMGDLAFARPAKQPYKFQGSFIFGQTQMGGEGC